MLKIRKTNEYLKWFNSLKNKQAKSKILTRFKQFKQIGKVVNGCYAKKGVYEIKFEFGAGYRIYYTYYKKEVIFLLAGGSKKRQQNDIDKAVYIKERLNNERNKKQ